MSIIDKPLTNLQVELLKIYSLDVSDQDLKAIQRLIARYFADKASDEMDKLWQENGWTNETMNEWLTNGAFEEIQK